MAKSIIVCKECGEIKRLGGYGLCTGCYQRKYHKAIQKTCRHCHKIFITNYKKTKYCSLKCVGIVHGLRAKARARKVKLACRNCNKEFFRPFKKRYRKFCSNKCYHEFRKDKPLNLSEEERQRRRERAYQIGLNQYWAGKKHSLKTKKRLSEIKIKHNSMRGKKLTVIHKQKIARASKERWQNPEYRQKMLAIRKEQGAKEIGANNPNWKNGASIEVNYGPGWKRAKRLALKRDKYICQKCGIQRGLFYPIELDVHHIIPFRISHNNSLKNLITVCRYCHGKLESAFVNNIEKKSDFSNYSINSIKEKQLQIHPN